VTKTAAKRVLSWAAAIAVAGGGVVGGLAVVGSLRANRPCTDLGRVDAFKTGTVFRLRCAPLYVVNVSNRPLVFVARSPTGSGVAVTWDEGIRTFISPHGEKYDATGHPIAGPTDRSMWRCPTRVTRGHLVLAVAKASGQTLLRECETK